MQYEGTPRTTGPQVGQVRDARRRVSAALKTQAGYLALAIIVNILLFYLFQTGIASIVVLLLRPFALTEQAMALVNELYSLLVYLVAFLLPYLGYAHLVGYRVRMMPRDRPDPPVLASCIGCALALSVVGMLASWILAVLLSVFGLYPPDLSMTPPSGAAASLLYLINMTAVPALLEEFTYRGIVLSTLRPYGDKFAIVVSSLLFALLHRNTVQLPNALVLGAALGYFMIKTNSIWTSIAIHFANNLLALILSAVFADNAALLLTDVLYLALGRWGLYYLRSVRRADMRIRPSGCLLDQRACYRGLFLSLPMALLMLLYLWIFALSFYSGG